MIDMPVWLVQYLPELRCPECGSKVVKDSVVAVGIRGYYEGKNKDEYVTWIAIEHKCPKCDGKFIFDISRCSMKNFVYEMMCLYGLFGKNQDQVVDTLQIEDEDEQMEEMEETYDNTINENLREYDRLIKGGDQKSHISDEEINNFRKRLNTAKTWRQTLESMGVSDQDTERYLDDELEDGDKNES